mmetsp:Transcript_31760/g.81344  ORF Transcript_31760/g.81344 Transcript_31760/m.81344 type:complete len:252 (-) Transcript_31760:564-1319(-)
MRVQRQPGRPYVPEIPPVAGGDPQRAMARGRRGGQARQQAAGIPRHRLEVGRRSAPAHPVLHAADARLPADGCVLSLLGPHLPQREIRRQAAQLPGRVRSAVPLADRAGAAPGGDLRHGRRLDHRVQGVGRAGGAAAQPERRGGVLPGLQELPPGQRGGHGGGRQHRHRVGAGDVPVLRRRPRAGPPGGPVGGRAAGGAGHHPPGHPRVLRQRRHRLRAHLVPHSDQGLCRGVGRLRPPRPAHPLPQARDV